MTLDTIIYVISDDGSIKETTICDLEHLFVETTTTHQGILPRYHLRGTEVWTWGPSGQYPKVISKHETEEEAQAELDEIRMAEFNGSDIVWFDTRSAAAEFLSNVVA